MKKLISMFLALAMALSLLPMTVLAVETTGEPPAEGNTQEPAVVDTSWYNETDTEFTISTLAELKGLAQLVNDGNAFTGKTVKLGADIDLSNEEWTPIGKDGKPFGGSFDGQNNTISNLKITGSNSKVGLFGYVGGNAEANPKPQIKNLTLTNVDISGTSYVGSIAGNGFVADFVNCTVNGTVKLYASASYVGGIVGHFYGEATRCTISGDANSRIANDPAKGGYVGGISGQIGENPSSTINSCMVTNVTLAGDCVGGICGIAQYGSRIVGNTVKDVTITTEGGSAGFNGLVTGDNRGKDNTPSYVINNLVENVTATNPDGSAMTNIAGIGYSGGNTVVGTGVTFDESGEKVTTGTFEVEPPASLLPEGKMFVENQDGTFGISDYYAAKIGDDNYPTFAAAFNAAKAATDPTTITLYDDVTLEAALEITNTLTLDLNGKDVTTSSTNLTAIDNKGTLTIQDSSNAGTGSITAFLGVENSGTLVINSGTIIAGGQGGAAVRNTGTFTMNGGELKATFVGDYGDSTGGSCLRNMANAEATITGGTLDSVSMRTYAIISNGTLTITPASGKEVAVSGYRGVAIDAGTTVINGGTFTVKERPSNIYAPETYYALYVGGNDASVTVNGGTFNAPDDAVWRPNWNEEATDLVINGGTFNASLIGNDDYYPSKDIIVYGGTFAEDPTDFLASGYRVTDNGDGTFTVSKKPTSSSGGSSSKPTTPAPSTPVVNPNSPTVDSSTTNNTDGSTTVTENKQDGTKVETTTGTDGTKTETASKTETVETATGTTTTTKTETKVETPAGDKVTSESVEKVEAKKDGTTATTTTTETKTEAQDGTTKTETTVVETLKDADGTETTTAKTETKLDNGSTGTTTVAADGTVKAEVTVTAAAVDKAAETSAPVALPMPAVTASADTTVSVSLPTGTSSAKVEVPVADVNPGVVAVIVNADGTEEIVKTTAVTEEGVALPVTGDVTLKLVDNSKDFDDVAETDWSDDAVTFVSAREIMNGTSTTTFQPAQELDRGMMAQVLHNLENNPQAAAEGNAFTDVADSAWFHESVTWAAETGILTGYGDGTYGPGDNITREQLATILFRYAQNKGYDVTGAGDLSDFRDGASTSEWASQAMAWAVSSGIMNGKGDGILDPTGDATRAEVATMVMKFCQNVAQ